MKTALASSGVDSTFKVLTGVSADEQWILYQHRKRAGTDVFMVWNGNDAASKFTARLTAAGYPELWHPTHQTITRPEYERVSGNQVDVTFHLNREEAVLVVFNPAGSSTSVCRTDVDQVLDIRGTGADAEVDVVVSANQEYTIDLKEGNQYFQKTISVSGLPSPIPVVDGSATLDSDYLNADYIVSVDVGSAESARVNVNQDYTPHQGNGGLAGGVLISTDRVDITARAVAGSNRIQIQPADPGDANVIISRKITVTGFTESSGPRFPKKP